MTKQEFINTWVDSSLPKWIHSHINSDLNQLIQDELTSETVKIKAITEHMTQDERNEYFDNRIKHLTK